MRKGYRMYTERRRRKTLFTGRDHAAAERNIRRIITAYCNQESLLRTADCERFSNLYAASEIEYEVFGFRNN